MGIPELIDKFVEIWSKKQEIYLKVGKASNINREDFTFTFTPIDESAAIEDVRMKVIADGGSESFMLIPEENSFVVVDFHDYVNAQCVSVQKCDEVIINAKITTFNNGDNQGMIKINELTEKLNTLVSTVNDLISNFNSHTHVGVSTGGGTSGVTTMQSQTASNFDKSDYENEKIKH